MTLSASMTSRARSSSRPTSARIPLVSAVSAWLAIVSSLSFNPANSCSKCRVIISAESAGHIILSLFPGRVGKDFPRRVIFDQFTDVKEGGVIGNARRLLHVMRYDHDG